VLPEHFLYEIDETDVVHETFEYEYKAKYTNDQVIPVLNFLKKTSKGTKTY
jgi:hypothetical protein